MTQEFDKLLKKAGKIVDNAPFFAKEKDKQRLLIWKFRLDREDTKAIMRLLKNLKT